jgi:hypothetical protein
VDLLPLIAVGKLIGVKRRARHLALDAQQREFLEKNATCMLCALAVLYVGGSFYNHAYLEVVWIVLILSSSLSKLSTEMINAELSRQPSTERKSIYG